MVCMVTVTQRFGWFSGDLLAQYKEVNGLQKEIQLIHYKDILAILIHPGLSAIRQPPQ